jgi:translation initiation factor 3 subunit C
MSRFWAAGSSSESESGSDDDSEIEQNQQRAGGKFGSTFQESDSDSEDEKRVVKSQKDRAWDTMRESIVRIKNARKTNDWSVIQDEFDEVNKMVEKSKMLVMKNGLPKFYVKMLADVEDHLWATLKDKEVMNSVKPAIGRAINRMKLTIKKHNKNYEEQIADYRANPDKYEEDDDGDADDDDDDDDSDDSDADSDADDDSEDEKPKAKPKAAQKVRVVAPLFPLPPLSPLVHPLLSVPRRCPATAPTFALMPIPRF